MGKNQSHFIREERLANIKGFEFVVFMRSVVVLVRMWPLRWMLGRKVLPRFCRLLYGRTELSLRLWVCGLRDVSCLSCLFS